VYTARTAQSPGTRNYDGQTPLRLAATTLAKQMLGLGMHRPDTFTYAHLHEAVDKLVTEQCVTDGPAPLLQAAGDVLALADVLRQPFQCHVDQVWRVVLHQRRLADRGLRHRPGPPLIIGHALAGPAPDSNSERSAVTPQFTELQPANPGQ
jgi:hypothetical protein